MLGQARASALVDIKHAHKLAEVFARHRPEVVFDAAAYKHVPFMEAHPDEAVRFVRRVSTLARGGAIFVLEMGEPVRIAEMARDLVRLRKAVCLQLADVTQCVT